MIQDILSTIAIMAFLSAGAVLVVGCLDAPSFVGQCPHCGEYIDDAPSHLKGCSPCR